jgi:hypothetical protein
MDHLAGARFLNREEQLFLKHPVMDQLVLRHVDYNDPYLELGEVLLEFQTAVDGEENIKLLLRQGKENVVFQGIPPFIVNRAGFVIAEK